MGFFSKIADKIFHHSQASAAPSGASLAPVSATPAAAPAPAATLAPAPVDVEAVLSAMSEIQRGGGSWRTSIVDFLKLLKLDSNLQARKELAEELGVHAGENGSAEQNIALQKAVMKKLADNGGQVPASLYQ